MEYSSDLCLIKKSLVLSGNSFFAIKYLGTVYRISYSFVLKIKELPERQETYEESLRMGG
jgi:hypothetical protein